MSLPNLAAPSVLSASKLNGPSNLSTTNHISLLHRLYYNRTIRILKTHFYDRYVALYFE